MSNISKPKGLTGWIFALIPIALFCVIFLWFRTPAAGAGTSAADTFTRTTSNGWGTADTGGGWTVITGTASDFSTDGSAANASVPTANTNRTLFLNSVSNQDIVTAVRFKTDKVASGGPMRIYVVGRHVSNGNEYRGRVTINTSGTVQLQGTALVSSVETLLGAANTVSGITYAPNTYYWVKVSVTGTNPTTIAMKLWADGNSEPGSYTYTSTDASGILQASGSVGLQSTLTTSVNNFPVVFSYDDYTVTNSDVVPSPTPSPSPTPTPSPVTYNSAADTFARSVSAGWGTADTGGDYTLTGTAADFNVTSGQATINAATASLSRYAMLNSTSIQNVDMMYKFKIDKLPTTGSSADAGVAIIARRNGIDEYRGRFKITTAGTFNVIATKLVGNVETNIGSTVIPAGTPAADTYYWVRAQFDGLTPTTIKLKMWQDGTSEPGSWQYSQTDSEATLQQAGPVGFRASLPTAITNAPILFTYANMTAGEIPPSPTPTPPPSYTLSGTVYIDADGNGVQDVGENGYQGVTVSVTGPGTASTTTDSSGNFSLPGLVAGTYTETVTMPSGYLATTTNPVTVPLSADTTSNTGIQSAITSTVATDTFTRSVASGWGTADTGGSYTMTGASTSFNTTGTTGTIDLTGTGSVNQRSARLDSVSAKNLDYTMRIKYDKLPDAGTGNYVFLIARHVSSGNEYRGWIRFDTAGALHLRSSKIVSNAETALGVEATVPGITYVAGTWLDVHLQLVGGNPTTINLRAWTDGTSEPGTWQYTTTDSSSLLQQAGSIGVLSRLGSVTNLPVQAGFDDLNVINSAIITPSPTPTPSPSPSPTTPYSFSSNITKVFTIVLENEDFSNIHGSSSAPYLNSLITGLNSDNTFNPVHSDVVYASNYKSVLPGETGSGYLHPSEPNYIWMEAGTNDLGDTVFTADNTPTTQSTTSTAHISTLLQNAGKNWRAYLENKPAGCPIGNGSLFIPRHSPFVYFQDVSSLLANGGIGAPSASSTYCQQHEFDFSQLATDLAGTGNGVADYNFITPNTCDDGHDSGCAGGNDKVKNADTWLQNNLPTILNSNTYKAGHAVIFIMTDEDSGSTSNNPIGMLAISPQSKGNGYTNNIAYSHSSYVKTIENIFGLSPYLGHANDGGTHDFSDLFGDPIVAAAGDIACGAGSANAACQQQATSDVIAQINPSVVLPLGDNQYEQGALSDFQTFYGPTWGVFKALTEPSVGNHEYLTSGAAGYFDYFNGVGNQLGQAGDRAKGYYAYSVGNWRLYALNTNCSQAGGCGPGSPQESWLKADLIAHPNQCKLAYAHHPMYSSGQQPHNSGVDTLYGDLYDQHGDIYLVGHDHNYERFYPSDKNGQVDPTNGVTEFVVGTGGRNHTQLGSTGLLANSAVFDSTTFGVMKLTLHNASFDWQFIPSADTMSFTNGTFSETGTGQCHWAANPAPSPSPTPTPTPASQYMVSGTIYHDTDADGNGVQDVGETGFSGVNVSITGPNTSTSATTDTNGAYSFPGLYTGSYTVTVKLPNGYFATTANPVVTNVTGDTTVNVGLATITSGYQPTAPFYTTFFYNWYKNPTVDGANQWGIWSDPDVGGTHSPSSNWFSNYLPQPTPNTFTPATELYSSNDYNIFKWQLTELAKAKQQVAVASWWGQGDRSDTAFSHQVTDYMNRGDNPYPNLRWGIYYECEGNTCNGTSNPSVAQIVADLNYIESNYANQPSYLKINNKPVIFVYGDPTDGGTSNSSCNDSSMTARWYQANQQATTPFYIVLKVFSGFATDACQPDDWHQYAPAVRTDQQGSHSFMVSPGFWRSGDQVRLPRDLSSFTTAVQSMVAANTTWKITETWNEWGEGSAVEPGVEVTQANGGVAAAVNPNGAAFGENYTNILNIYLPNLPQGTGVNGSPSPTPSPTPSPVTHTISGTVYVDSNDDGVQDNGELGVNGATVNLSGAASNTTTTNSSGLFTFSNINDGTYIETLTPPVGYSLTTANPVTSPVTTNTTVNFGIQLTPSPTPTASGSGGTVIISNVNTIPTADGAILNWTTDKQADSEITYGFTSLYTDTVKYDVDGVFNHSIILNGLQPCASYHYKITSLTDVGDTASTNGDEFTTLGCAGNSAVLNFSDGLIAITSGGVVNVVDQNNYGLSLTVPRFFSNVAADFQVHQLYPSDMIKGAPLPFPYNVIPNYSFSVIALKTPAVTLTNFDQPLTVSIHYAARDLAGTDNTHLHVMQYHNGAWSEMAGCIVDLVGQRLTCPTTTFSLFALVTTDSLGPSNNSSSSNSNNSGSSNNAGSVSSVCSTVPPLGSPIIYEIDTTATTATLYAVPPGAPFDSFTISYGPNAHDDYYAYNFATGFQSGAIKIPIQSLHLNSYYTFKIRSNNGCQPGPWSPIFTTKTGFLPFRKNKYYLWQQKSLYTTVKKKRP